MKFVIISIVMFCMTFIVGCSSYIIDPEEKLEKQCLASLAISDSIIVKKQVLIIAHRGESKNYPENTIPAFESAIKLKADMIEFDIWMTKDQIPVVIHDEYLGRTTDIESVFGADGKVSDYSFQEIQTLFVDGGYGFSQKFAGSLKIPSAENVIKTFSNKIGMMINIKNWDPVCVQTINQLLDKYNVSPDSVWAKTNKANNVTKYKKYKTWCTVYLENYSTLLKNEECNCAGDIYSVQYGPGINSIIEAIKSRNREIVVWTVSSEIVMQQLDSQTKLTGILVDDVSLAIQNLRK